MSKNQEITKDDANVVITAENGEDPDLEELPPPVVTRTRSGRRVRPPAFLDSQPAPTPAKTPARKSRKSVIQELPGETNPEVPDVEHIPASHDNTTTHSATDKADELISNEQGKEVRVVGLLESAPEPPNNKKRTHSESSEKRSSIPLGKPKSGRVWKDRNKQRFSSLVRDKTLCTSWGKKMEAKREKDLLKKYSLELKEDKARKKEDKRKRREENLKRREENERKGEVVQVIRNTTKIKRMKKKQLRKIEKRDTLALLQKSQPRTPKATAGNGTKSHRKEKQ